MHEIKKYITDNILIGESYMINENVSFQETGIIDSLGFLELITYVEEMFNIKIMDDELIPENFDSLQKISHFVEKKLAKKKI